MLAAGGSGGGGGSDGGGPHIVAGSGQTQQVTKIKRRFKIVPVSCLLGIAQIFFKSNINF